MITAETIAERGQHNIIDAVTQNATGFTASPAPGNGGVSFNTRGFTGTRLVMTLYDGTRLYIGSGTVTFPFDTWSTERIEVLRGPASVMYGAGAVGGAINVVTKLPLWVPRNQAEISLDSNMTRATCGGQRRPGQQGRRLSDHRLRQHVRRLGRSRQHVQCRTAAVVQIKQNEDVTWTLSTDYGDRSPSRYFGTPLINGKLDEALRFKNYNVSDSHIRYQDSWNQAEDRMASRRRHHPPEHLYYLNTKRHWNDVENYAYNPATGLINRSSYIEIFHDQQQIGDRMDATFRGHVFGMVNEFVAGFDVNRINFTSTNNSPFGGTSSVNPYVRSGLLHQPERDGAGVQFRDQPIRAVRREPAVGDRPMSLIAGVRQDEPTVTHRPTCHGRQQF